MQFFNNSKSNQMKTEQHYKKEIAIEFQRIMELEHNKEAVTKFREILGKIKPKSCIVKSGCRSGNNIDFLLAFEKGGNENPFDLFIENIPDIAFRYGVIFGLNPNIFHFNPLYSIEDETHYFVNFKLIKHE
jgi:hypothetical protein